jgi:hypothetical protein
MTPFWRSENCQRRALEYVGTVGLTWVMRGESVDVGWIACRRLRWSWRWIRLTE